MHASEPGGRGVVLSAAAIAASRASQRRAWVVSRFTFMKAIIVMVCLVVSVGVCVAQTNEAPLVKINAKDFGNTNSPAKALELERNGNTSKIKVVNNNSRSVGESMFVALAFFEVAKARGFEYFINLKEWTDNDGGRIYIAGFTNRKNADVKKEFGAPYTAKDQNGERRTYLSVSQFKRLWPDQVKKPNPAAPQP